MISLHSDQTNPTSFRLCCLVYNHSDHLFMCICPDTSVPSSPPPSRPPLPPSPLPSLTATSRPFLSEVTSYHSPVLRRPLPHNSSSPRLPPPSLVRSPPPPTYSSPSSLPPPPPPLHTDRHLSPCSSARRRPTTLRSCAGRCPTTALPLSPCCAAHGGRRRRRTRRTPAAVSAASPPRSAGQRFPILSRVSHPHATRLLSGTRSWSASASL